jgi:hypothetical protein
MVVRMRAGLRRAPHPAPDGHTLHPVVVGDEAVGGPQLQTSGQG